MKVLHISSKSKEMYKTLLKNDNLFFWSKIKRISNYTCVVYFKYADEYYGMQEKPCSYYFFKITRGKTNGDYFFEI